MMTIFKVQTIPDMLSDMTEDKIFFFYSFQGFIINPSSKQSELMHISSA